MKTSDKTTYYKKSQKTSYKVKISLNQIKPLVNRTFIYYAVKQAKIALPHKCEALKNKTKSWLLFEYQ